MNYHPILDEYVPLVRRVLSESEDSKLSGVGRDGRIKFLVEAEVTQKTLEIYDVLIESLRSDNRPPNAEVPLQKLRDALQPQIGKTLLRTMIRMPGRAYEIYADPETETVVHVSEIPDAVENSSPINMNLEWFDTIEDDASYRSWLEEDLFPKFFDESCFEASHTLYHVDLQVSLLEDAVFRGIEPAGFQKADLNEALRIASSDLYGHHETKWFHVNVDDNVARSVKRFGQYSFDWPLVPVYILLQYHPALEGGTTYAGLASADREWVLLFKNSLHISVHGEKRFVDRFVKSLEQASNN